MKRLLIIVLCFIIFNSSIVLAGEQETVNDLLELYNKEKLIAMQELEEEYNKVQNNYNNILKEKEITEIYNSYVDIAEEYQRTKVTELQSKVNTIVKENIRDMQDIKTNICGDLEFIIARDKEIKMNIETIDSLLDETKKYQLTNKVTFDNTKVDLLKEDLDVISGKYKESVKVATLGSVKNIHYPLAKPSKVNSGFGYRVDPVSGSYVAYHSGLDLYAVQGTEVLSIFNGVVEEVGYSYGGGNYVKINHGNGVVSIYMHLLEPKCKEGDIVNQYDVIALSGNTGASTTGAHLHFGLYINNEPQDPSILFK